MWLSGLHIPKRTPSAGAGGVQGQGWPLDKSTLYTKVTRYTDPSGVPEVAAHSIQGLYLGASWDLERSLLKRGIEGARHRAANPAGDSRRGAS